MSRANAAVTVALVVVSLCFILFILWHATVYVEEDTQSTQYDYAIIHVHADGTTTPWLSDDRPTQSGGFLFFDAKGIDVLVRLSGDLTIVRIEEGSMPALAPKKGVGPARHNHGVIPMVATESLWEYTSF